MSAHDVAVEAEHDGYLQRFGARHRRREEQHGRRIVITDRLVGAARSLPVEIGFLLHPDLTAARDDAGWVVGGPDSPLVRIAGGEPLDGAAENGAESPRGGWHSPAFGTLQPATRLTFRGAMDQTTACRFTIDILDFDGPERPHRDGGDCACASAILPRTA